MPQLPSWVLVALSEKVAASGPAKGRPSTPENDMNTLLFAVTVVVPPALVVIAHACWAPFCWTYWAKVTGTAAAGDAMAAANMPQATAWGMSRSGGARMWLNLLLWTRCWDWECPAVQLGGRHKDATPLLTIAIATNIHQRRKIRMGRLIG